VKLQTPFEVEHLPGWRNEPFTSQQRFEEYFQSCGSVGWFVPSFEERKICGWIKCCAAAVRDRVTQVCGARGYSGLKLWSRVESIRFVSCFLCGTEHRLNLRHHRVLREIEKFGAVLCWIISSVSSRGAFVQEVISLAEVHALSILQAGVLRGGRHGQFFLTED
jgi:hypothetical protein